MSFTNLTTNFPKVSPEVTKGGLLVSLHNTFGIFIYGGSHEEAEGQDTGR